jgi:hypothetical protein
MALFYTSQIRAEPIRMTADIPSAYASQIRAEPVRLTADIPSAPRPQWLPTSGPGQKNVNPLLWSLSVEQWIFFISACVATDTWKALVEKKGEYNINMYDVKHYFVKPWTQGTGCSIALLMNAKVQLKAEGMFSHAWAGSVVETYNCLQNMVNHSGVPKTARFFFCTFSMYQGEDGVPNGLYIKEQIAMKPFAKIIESNPKHGIFVIHTTLSEVYERLWVTHEADVGIHENVQMHGLFDMYRWTVKKFEDAAAVKTSKGKCDDADRNGIETPILQRPPDSEGRRGYERLDHVIEMFRKKMLGELRNLMQRVDLAPLTYGRAASGKVQYFQKFGDVLKTTCKFDWELLEYNKPYVWKFKSQWSMQDVAAQFACKAAGTALPLGASSRPFADNAHIVA